MEKIEIDINGFTLEIEYQYFSQEMENGIITSHEAAYIEHAHLGGMNITRFLDGLGVTEMIQEMILAQRK